MKSMLLKFALSLAFRKLAPNSIPISGERALGNDCYAVYLEFPSENWKFLINENLENGCIGRLWENERDGRDVVFLKTSIYELKPKPKIEHYWKGYQFDYYSSLSFLIGTAVHKHRFILLWDKFLQRTYNRTQLVRADRLDLLRRLVEETITKPGTKFDPIFLGIRLHSNRWFYHPERSKHEAHLRLILDSLVATGDLKKGGFSYEVEPKAIATLAEFEYQEQQHQDSIRTSRTANNLTKAVVFIGICGILAQILMWYMGDPISV